jgi:dTDP-4-amino-4,6-dideoxygalactose transaminase
MNWKMPLFKTYWEEDDIEAVASVIKRGMYWADGPEIGKFEKNIADYIGVKYALAFNSGTSALHTLLLAHNIRGGEVIVPSFTFIATANAVVLAGGIPVFAEVESDSCALDALDVKRKITSKTKGVILVHYGGFPAKNTKAIRKIAQEKKILFIEDNAESLGAHINNKKTGGFGDSAILSLCQNKIISTGEGGLIVTNIQKVFEKAKLLRSHGRVELADDYFSSSEDNDYIQVGYNFRMPTLLAALGTSQLNKINKIIELRREKAKYLIKHLSKIRHIRVFQEQKGFFSVYQMFPITLTDKKKRDALQQYLAQNGIMSKVYFNPVHLKTIYQRNYKYGKGDLPYTEALSEIMLNLPIYPGLTKDGLNYIVSKIQEFFNRS